jgi:outer membrane protein assembly factor BamB
MNKQLSFILIAAALTLGQTVRAETEWNGFRGPTGRGHSAAKEVPVKWSAANVVWKLDLKGAGQSSPVNAGDKLFLTTASKDGQNCKVICVDRTKGKLLWERAVKSSNPGQHHKMNSFATPTCVTDGERVIAFFGAGGMHCFDLDGKKQWSKDLGELPGSWGIAASPVIVANKVIQNLDAVGASSLVALDKLTGETVWSTKREDKPRGGWSTPVLIDVGSRKELVLNGEFGVRAYDPESGKELWFCKGFNGRGAPVPDFDGKTLYVVNGKPGDIYAVTPGGSGDVSKSRMKWHSKRQGGRDLPSPATVDGYVMVVSMSGVATCYDAESGTMHWSERLPLQSRGEFAAAPLVVNGKVYIQNVYGGNTVVIKPGKTMQVLAENSLGANRSELFRATLAPIGGRLYARSQSTLYCIKP